MEELIKFLSQDTIQLMVNFVSYGIISLAGAIMKELHKANTKPHHEFDPLNVIISTVVATPIAIFIKQRFHDYLDGYWGIMGLISLILGLTGYEIFYHISSLAGLKRAYKTVNKIAEGIDELIPDEQEPEMVKKKRMPDTTAEKVIHIQDPSLTYNIRRPVIHRPQDPGDIDDGSDG